MVKILQNTVVMLACCLFLITGCSGKNKGAPEPVSYSTSPVTCIGVLPAVPGVDLEESVTSEQAKSLRKGVAVMNRLLRQELAGQENVTFVQADHIAGVKMTGGEKAIEYARLIGKSIGCNAILETTIWRYTERVGGKYTAESPASVAFNSRLIGLDQSAVIWSAKFDEVQVSVLENIYEWKKANLRGFTWISAEDLMLEGLQEKLDKSPYFTKQTPSSDSDIYDDNI